MEHLLGRYGSLMFEVLAPAAEKPELLEPVEGAPEYLMAEVAYAVTHEGAIHLEDVLSRRLRVTMEYDHRGVQCAPSVAQLMASYLDWDESTTQKEIRVFEQRTKAALDAERAVSDAAANAIAAAAPDSRSSVNTEFDR